MEKGQEVSTLHRQLWVPENAESRRGALPQGEHDDWLPSTKWSALKTNLLLRTHPKKKAVVTTLVSLNT